MRYDCNTNTHIHFNGHFPGKLRLVSCPLDSQSPFVLILSILTKQARIKENTISVRLKELKLQSVEERRVHAKFLKLSSNISTMGHSQSGFMRCRSALDAILALRLLAEIHREFQQPLFSAFVDLKSAFD